VAVQPQVNSAGNSSAEQQSVSAVKAENAAAVAALLLLEKQAVEAVAGPMRTRLADLFRSLAGRYVLLTGGLDRPIADPAQARALQQIYADGLADLREFAEADRLADFARQALGRGLDYANRYLADPVTTATLPAEVVQAIDNLDQQISEKVGDALHFADQTPLTGWDDLVRQVGKAHQIPNSVERTVTTVVNRANGSAIRQAAVAKGASLLWVAEPDACVICLALSGHVIDPSSGDGFDEEATFGKPGSAPDVWPPGEPLMEPPRHPYCRCHPELWFGPHVPEGGPEENALYNRPGVAAGVDLPAALRREAKRSVVYGWSLPSESNKIRLDAAGRLLQAGAGLPRTVEERAHKAVARGEFDNRIHPSRRTAKRDR
jgi:hypothetical protein